MVLQPIFTTLFFLQIDIFMFSKSNNHANSFLVPIKQTTIQVFTNSIDLQLAQFLYLTFLFFWHSSNCLKTNGKERINMVLFDFQIQRVPQWGFQMNLGKNMIYLLIYDLSQIRLLSYLAYRLITIIDIVFMKLPSKYKIINNISQNPIFQIHLILSFLIYHLIQRLLFCLIQINLLLLVKVQLIKMKSLSLRQNSESSHRPHFQTKMKSLNTSELNDLKDSIDAHKFMQTQKSKHDHDFCMANEDSFNKTASKLNSTNFGHHDDQNCVCNDCHCGRHLCKLHVIKPDLTKNTVYQRSFYNQKAIPNIVNHDKEYDKLLGPHLDMNSTYLDGFKGKEGDKIERPKPQDLLKSNGPCPQLSSYSAQFPGYRGDNQYVKPTDQHTRGSFPLRSRSTYAKEFVKKDSMKDDYTYFPDQLRTKSNWFGKTTYENAFNNPNPQYFAKKVKVVQKLQEKPDFSRQYETIYKNDFIPKPNPLCPSKIHLQTKGQGQFNQTKANFAENADFKALSPQFHAISTSKHSYV